LDQTYKEKPKRELLRIRKKKTSFIELFVDQVHPIDKIAALIRNIVFLAELFNQYARFREIMSRKSREKMMFNLIIESSSEPIEQN
jgi:uncharacterized protein YktA (UPF0223 family)